MTQKFKISDRVSVKGGCAHSGFEGRIVEFKNGPQGEVAVVDDDYGHRLAFRPDELEEAGSTTLSAPG